MITGGQALAMQNQLNFSRDMEREADRIGFGVLTQAGFEPQGFVTMFEKLQQASRLNDNGSYPVPAHAPADDRAHGGHAGAPAARSEGPGHGAVGGARTCADGRAVESRVGH